MATYRFLLYSDDDTKLERGPCIKGDETCEIHSRGGWCVFKMPAVDVEAATEDEARAKIVVPDGMRIWGYWDKTEVDKSTDV